MNENLHEQLARLLSGYWYTQTIYLASKLAIAELLKDRPRPVQELAEATGTNPRALYRLLRAIFTTDESGEDGGQKPAGHGRQANHSSFLINSIQWLLPDGQKDSKPRLCRSAAFRCP
jgi:hypothetical protein